MTLSQDNNRIVGTIRRNLRAARDALSDECATATQLVQTPLPDVPEELPLAQAQLTRETQLISLETGIAEVEIYDNEYQNFIARLETQAEQEAETAVYETTAHGKSPMGHLRVLRSAKSQSGMLRLQLQKIADRLNQTDSKEANIQASNSSHEKTSVKRPLVKLPPLTLPTFDGDVMKWSQFWQRFQAAIDTNKELSDDEKFNYLDGCLKGRARIPVAGISVVGSNYSTAVDLLKKQFQLKPEIMIIRLLRSLKQMRCPSSKIEDVQATYFNVTKIIRQLEESGENMNSNKSLAMDVLLVFGPAKSVIKEVGVRMQLSAMVKNMEPDNSADDQSVGGVLDGLAACSVTEILDTLRQFLNGIVEIDDLTDTLSPDAKQYNTSKHDKRSINSSTFENRAPEINSSTFVSSYATNRQHSSQRFSKPPKPCVFCGEPHFHRDCHSYSSYNQRLQRLKQLKVCFRCLKPNHTANECRSTPKCFNCRAEGHLSAICPKNKYVSEESTLVAGETKPAIIDSQYVASEKHEKRLKSSSDTASTSKKPSKTQTGFLTLMGTEDRSILSCAVVTIRNPISNETSTARLLFDSASSCSYITADLAKKLNLESSTPFVRTVSTFASESLFESKCSKTKFEIQLKDVGTLSIQADVIPFITKTEVTPVNLPSEINEFIVSMPYAMADYSTTGPPDILLGNDYFLCFITGKPVPVYENVYYLPTKVGLVLGGTFKASETTQETNPVLLTITNRPEYDVIYSETPYASKKAVPDLEKFWNLEGIGISDDPKDKSDEIAEQQFEMTAKLVDGRWQVAWPYNDKIDQLPSNYGQAYGRFVSLAQRMKKSNLCVREEYSKVIQQQLDNDIIEEVPHTEIKNTTNKVHYLSHHAVIKVDHATTKIRIVYDASAKPDKDSVSLNQCMHRGPVLLPDLVALILRFRLKPIAIIADIEKAFLQLSLRPEDRDVTRFLWFRNPLEPGVHNYRTLRFKRVPFGVISSPSLLAQTIQLHLKRTNSDTARLISHNIYVDNFIASVENEKRAVELYNETKSLFEECSMNMRECVSNSNVVTNSFRPQDQSKSQQVKMLGLKWDSSTDTLKLNGDWSRHGSCETKRQILRAISSVFDPTGIYQPVVLLAKLFLRKLWQTTHSWDDRLPPTFQQEWIDIHQRMLPIFKHIIPRCFSNLFVERNASICVFCDASGHAFSACAYLRVKAPDDSDSYNCSLVFAKARVAPQQKTKAKQTSTSNAEDISLPKLELLALTIGTRMGNFVKTALRLPEDSTIMLFSDSTCVLGWLRTTKKLPIFVKNRVSKIRSLDFAEYRHVSSKDNAADVCSRGTDGASLLKHNLWWSGPPWLSMPKSRWPNSSESSAITSEQLQDVVERTNDSVVHFFVAREGPAEGSADYVSPFLIDAANYSSFGRLIRVTSVCLRFCYFLWTRCSEEFREQKPIYSQLMTRFESETSKTSKQWSIASNLWIKSEQSVYYADVLAALRSGRKSLQLIRQLDLFIDKDGVIRCGGRLHKMEMPPDAINPILLSSKSHVTWLIVKQVHHQCLHAGINHTLNQIRMRFWIPKGRALTRRLISSCVTCRKLKGNAFALPQMPNLPRERVARSYPFQYTGVDYLGPLNVKYQESKHKYWIAVFTCFTTRAVHLETVCDCTAQSFVNALSRFVARRGAPEKMLSDNAPQFKLAKTVFDKGWSKTLRDPNVISYMCEHRIDWCFIIELAPWQGGVYERLMCTIKDLFRAEVGRRLLGVDELNTLMTEVESIVNSRPITYVSADYKSGVALRPGDFLNNLATGLPEFDSTTAQPSGEASKFLTQMWKAKQRRLDKLWQRWREEYLLSLREQQTKHHARQHRNLPFAPKVNEIVLVHNENLPRGCWKLAKVVELIASNDGKIRAVELRLPNGQLIRRTLNHLYSLEIPSSMQPDENATREDNPGADNSDAFDGFEEDEVRVAEDAARAWQTNREQIVAEAHVNIALGLAFTDGQRQ